MSAAGAAGGCLVLDSGGLLALASGDSRALATLLLAARNELPVIVPTVVLAQVIRGGPQDAEMNRLLKRIDGELPITAPLARQAGLLLRRSATTDVVDALVAAIALDTAPAIILTSDPSDLRALVATDPAHTRIRIVAV